MNDTELTRLAAKAFGDAPDAFSPLTNDGDALRLAVKLNLLVQFNKRHIFVCDDAGVQLAFLGKKNDPYAATRRAIVRAAAEIGKAMT